MEQRYTRPETLSSARWALGIMWLILCMACTKQENRPDEHAHLPARKTDSIRQPTSNVSPKSAVIHDAPRNAPTKKDTTVVMSFKDLSMVYNYKIVDQYLGFHGQYGYDSLLRVIKIYNKQDSLVQWIYPKFPRPFSPWYFLHEFGTLKSSRSYITGKNAHYDDVDNYCGEIVVADLNFDGWEDFATPVGSGVDNGPHYAFYIQDSMHKFRFNSYLTKHVIWFPETIVDSLRQFTSTVPYGAGGMCYITFEYDPAAKRWKKTKDYTIDIITGKIWKPNPL